ncbi:MAG: 6-bladed beta-propeller [Oscillibacter sp.]|nr:6-bladed beta-propeller [Oscillibacter sp.]
MVKIDKVIEFNDERMESITKDIDSVVYLPLESNQMALYSNASKVVFRGGKIFIGDFFLHKIVVYSNTGQFLYTLSNRGRATNEYLEMKSFCITNHEIAIIDNSNHFLKTYDVETGRFLENKSMPFVAWDVEWLDNGEYAFAFSSLQKRYNPNKLRCRLFFTDGDLNITKKLFPYKKDEIEPIAPMTFFSLSQKKILFHWSGVDYFSVIDRFESDGIEIVAVDFGKKEIPEEYKGDVEKMNLGGYYYMGDTPITNGNYIAFDIATQRHSDCYLYSVRDDVMKRNYKNESMAMPFPACVDEQGRFIHLLDSLDEYEMFVADGFPRASKEVEEHIKNGGVVILKYVTR